MLSESRIRELVKWELKKDYYQKLNNRRKNMAVINFSEEDLVNAEKKKKTKDNEKQQKIKDKVNENWNKIFSNKSSNLNSSENANNATLVAKNNTNTQNNVNNVNQSSTSNTQNNVMRTITNQNSINTSGPKNTSVNRLQDNTNKENNVNLYADSNTQNEQNRLQSSNLNRNLNTSNANQMPSVEQTTTRANVSTSSNSAYQDLLDKINEIKNTYDVEPQRGETIDTELNLDRKELINKTDEELRSEAESALRDYRQSQLDAINNNAENGLSALEGKEDTLRTDAENEKAQVEEYYANARRQAENDALKRGLQRSSIVINNLNAFDNDKIAELMKIDQELGSEIDNLNAEIASLNAEREQALNNFNIEYALKVNEQIAELEQEIQDRNDEIMEYNNKIAQIEAEYRQSATETNNQTQSDYLDDLIEYGENKGIINSMRDDAYGKAIEEYLNTLSKEDAIAELENNSYIRELLGTNYAYYLYKTQQRKD